MKRILVRDYPSYAGHYIYNGYAAAWSRLGYEVVRWTTLNDHDLARCDLMCTSGDIIVPDANIPQLIDYFKQANKIYMFVSATKFPEPWCNHPNFIDQSAQKPHLIEALKSLDNIVFWTFCSVDAAPQYWEEWGKVHYVPLGFDNVNYQRLIDKKYEFDVCYIGGRANNGFDTKYQIMKKHFAAFKDSGLKCGFFIDKNLTHEQECKILTNSKVCINIHDDYQRKLRLDTNERTWKSLGLNGILVTDYVGPVIPNESGIYQVQSPEEMVKTVKSIVGGLKDIDRQAMIALANEKYTYIDRCKHMESL